jgi:hypothetical protein
MAATIAVRAPGEGFNAWKIPGAYFDAIVEITGDASYPLTATSGYPFGVTQLNTLTGGAFSLIESVDVINNWTDNAAGAAAKCFVANYDKTHQSVRAFGSNGAGPATLLEVANAANTVQNLTCSLRVRAH